MSGDCDVASPPEPGGDLVEYEMDAFRLAQALRLVQVLGRQLEDISAQNGLADHSGNLLRSNLPDGRAERVDVSGRHVTHSRHKRRQHLMYGQFAGHRASEAADAVVAVPQRQHLRALWLPPQ